MYISDAQSKVLAMVVHLENVSPTFARMPSCNTRAESTSVCPTIAKRPDSTSFHGFIYSL